MFLSVHNAANKERPCLGNAKFCSNWNMHIGNRTQSYSDVFPSVPRI
jgi:hypothetical protein